jgi:hypothetical protein
MLKRIALALALIAPAAAVAPTPARGDYMVMDGGTIKVYHNDGTLFLIYKWAGWVEGYIQVYP